MFRLFTNAVKVAHGLVAPFLGEGAVAVDATVGNGHDTLFLARHVGSSGKVYGFDIQAAALHNTGQRLDAAGLSQQVTLIQAGHEHMASYLAEPVDVMLFNLGYLPGGDHSRITRADTTVTAVLAGLEALKPGGMMSIVVYTGHSGAQEEQTALDRLVVQLEPRQYCVVRLEFANRIKDPPYLLLLEKSACRSGTGEKN